MKIALFSFYSIPADKTLFTSFPILVCADCYLRHLTSFLVSCSVQYRVFEHHPYSELLVLPMGLFDKKIGCLVIVLSTTATRLP